MDYILQLLKLISILGVFAVGSHLVIKKMKNQQFKKVSANQYIQIVDGVRVGMKEEVALLKVGNEYILMAVNAGTMIGLKQEEIHVPDQTFNELFEHENPKNALDKIGKSIREGLMRK